MKLYVIRHCESEDDIINAYGGCADFDLTEKGREIATNHINNIKDLGIEKSFTSPYKRAKHVADIFNNELKCEYEIVDGLKGMNIYGVLSGLNKDYARKLFAYLFDDLKYKSFGYYTGNTFKGGETVENFDNRVKKAFNYIVSQNYKTVAIVTHGGVFRSLYKNILNKDEYIADILDVGTIVLNYNDGVFNIESMSGVIFNKKD